MKAHVVGDNYCKIWLHKKGILAGSILVILCRIRLGMLILHTLQVGLISNREMGCSICLLRLDHISLNLLSLNKNLELRKLIMMILLLHIKIVY
jgi:hypothetical protein